MKRVTIDVREDKLTFFMELIQQFDFADVSVENDEEITEQYKGMYDAIVSLQQGKSIPS